MSKFRKGKTFCKLFKKTSILQTLRMNNLRILRIQDAKFSWYYFYMNTNIKTDFQICITVPLNLWFLNQKEKIQYLFQSKSWVCWHCFKCIRPYVVFVSANLSKFGSQLWCAQKRLPILKTVCVILNTQ